MSLRKQTTVSCSRRALSKSDANPSNCGSVTINIKTDDNPQQTTWKLTSSSNGGKSTSTITGGPYDVPNKSYTMTLCLSQGDCVFTIYDEGEDGLCCSHGNGSYELTLDGTVLKVGDTFDASESTSFAIGSSVTSSPTKKKKKKKKKKCKKKKNAKRPKVSNMASS